MSRLQMNKYLEKIASKLANNSDHFTTDLPDNPREVPGVAAPTVAGGLVGNVIGQFKGRKWLGTGIGAGVGLAAGALRKNHAVRHNEAFFSHPYAIDKVIPKSGLSTHLNLQDKYGVDTLRLRYNADAEAEAAKAAK